MSGLVARLAALVDAGQLSPADVLQYANYPDRVLSAQERTELGALVADMSRLVPQGRTDGAEYVSNDTGNAEYEARFAAGLVRKGGLGFASESDMDQNWEGAYFSMYHPVELNPQLRLFANQLNSNVSLVRPTTQRNQSVPMFLTPGIDRDPMGTRLKGQLGQLSERQAYYSQLIAQKRQELARITNPRLGGTPNPKNVATLQFEIKHLETQIAALDINRRQLYGTNSAFLDHASTVNEVAAAPAPEQADPVVNVEPSAEPPAQADILGLVPGSEDKSSTPPLQIAPPPVPALTDRAFLFDEAFRDFLLPGNVISGATGARNGPGDVKDHMRRFQGVDNAEGGSGGGQEAGEAPRLVMDRPAVADGYAGHAGNTLLGEVNASLRPELPVQSQLRYPIVEFNNAQDLLLPTLEAPLTSVPGNALNTVPTGEPYRNASAALEELQQRAGGSFDLRGHLSQGLGFETAPPGANFSITPTLRVSPEALEAQSRSNDFFLGQPGVPSVAGEPDSVADPFRPTAAFPAGVRLTVPSKSRAAVQSASLVAPSVPEKKAETSSTTKLKQWILTAPQKIVDLLNTAADDRVQIRIMELVMAAWGTGALTTVAKAILGSEPIIQQYFYLSGIPMDMGGQGYGHGGRGKRKRSVGSSRGRGRGSNKRHRHQHHHY